MDPFIGQVMLFAGPFAPRGWAFCDGQILSISSNDALFSILGTEYGGDGRTTFGLPDLRGRAPIAPGSGPGLSHYDLGQAGGVENASLTTDQLPSHTHSLHAETNAADQMNPQGRMLALPADPIYAEVISTDDRTMAPQSIASTGGNHSHYNLQPLLAINYIIALFGVYPPRN